MNVFFLDSSPSRAAEYHCDKHVVKMVLESAQLLSTAHHVLDGGSSVPLKKTHEHHPSAIWVRSSGGAYRWTFELFYCLLIEHQRRYGTRHSFWQHVADLRVPPFGIADGDAMPPPQVMPTQYQVEGDPVAAYRAYYRGDKARFARWKLGNVPPWWQ